MNKKIRTFVALAPGESFIKEHLNMVNKLKEENWASDVRWIPEKNCHLTMRFLGDIEQVVIPGVVAALKKETEKTPRFKITLSRIVFLPSPSKPRVIAIETDHSKLLNTLAKQVEISVTSCGFEAEKRRFRGHITIGRCKKTFPRNQTVQNKFEGLSVPVNEILLMKSELTPNGSIYSILGRIPLIAGN